MKTKTTTTPEAERKDRTASIDLADRLSFLTLDREQKKEAGHHESTCLLVRFGSRYYHIPHQDIAYIYSREDVNVLVTTSGHRLPVQRPLFELSNELDSKKFTQLASDLIASIQSIKGLIQRDGSKLCIDLAPDFGLRFHYDSRYGSTVFDYKRLLKKNQS